MDRIPERRGVSPRVLAAALAAALLLAGAGGALLLAGAASRPAPAVVATKAAANASGARAARVTRVVDGDTLDVRFADGSAERVRLYAVDTPETKGGKTEAFGPEAAAFSEREAGGREVWIEIGAVERDRYGRLLAYVWLREPAARDEADVRASMLNARLLEAGLAEVYRDSQDRSYMDLFYRIEGEARAAGRGMWSR